MFFGGGGGGDLHLAGINSSYFEFSFFHSAGWVPFRDNFNICAHLILAFWALPANIAKFNTRN